MLNFRITKIALVLLINCLTGSVFAETITVAATKFPNGDILSLIKPILAKQGYDLKIKEYLSYNDPDLILRNKSRVRKQHPNLDVTNGECDANFFQHVPYLNQYNTYSKTDLVVVRKVFYVPFAIYARKDEPDKLFNAFKIEDIQENSVIGIPNNSLNEARALKLLAAAKIISLAPNKLEPRIGDISVNPRHIAIFSMDNAILAQMLANKRIDFAVMNSGQAMQSEIAANKVIFIESQNSLYANVLVARRGEANSAKIQALAKALTSPEVKQYINTVYTGKIIPLF